MVKSNYMYSDDPEIQKIFDEGYDECYHNGVPACYNLNPYTDHEKFKAYDAGYMYCWNYHDDIRENYEHEHDLYRKDF